MSALKKFFACVTEMGVHPIPYLYSLQDLHKMLLANWKELVIDYNLLHWLCTYDEEAVELTGLGQRHLDLLQVLLQEAQRGSDIGIHKISREEDMYSRPVSITPFRRFILSYHEFVNFEDWLPLFDEAGAKFSETELINAHFDSYRFGPLYDLLRKRHVLHPMSNANMEHLLLFMIARDEPDVEYICKWPREGKEKLMSWLMSAERTVGKVSIAEYMIDSFPDLIQFGGARNKRPLVVRALMLDGLTLRLLYRTQRSDEVLVRLALINDKKAIEYVTCPQLQNKFRLLIQSGNDL